MRKSSIAVLGLFLLLYILPLGVRPIFIPDEVRYAEIPREMIVSGDWIVPHIDGLRYFEKPVLGYWLNATAMILFGQNPFALRFPSAMTVGISALIVFLLVQRFAGGYWSGIIAAVGLLTCLEVFAVGVSNLLDSVFSMFITLAMASFFFAYRESRSGTRTCVLALSGIFCGLAFLTKGFIAFVILVASIVPFMIWERQWKALVKVPWLPIITAILVSLPWCVMIHLREHDFWHQFFWVEHVKRFTSPIGDQHPEPFWFYFPIMMGGALPWSALLPMVIPVLRRLRLKDPLMRFAICWFMFPLLFFSASRGKLVTYILPCFPPLIILITVGLMNYLARGKQTGFTIVALSLAALMGIASALLLLIQMTSLPGFKIYGVTETWKWILGGGVLLAGSLLLVLASKAADSRRKIILYCAAPIIAMLNSHFIIPDQVKTEKAPGAFLLYHSPRVTPDTILVSDKRLVNAVCWFYQRDDVFLVNKGELEYGLGYNDSKHRQLDLDRFGTLFNKDFNEKNVVFIITRNLYTKYKYLFPKPEFEDISGDVVFAQF